MSFADNTPHRKSNRRLVPDTRQPMRRGSHLVGLLRVARGHWRATSAALQMRWSVSLKEWKLGNAEQEFSTMARTILLVVVAAVVAWAAYAYFTHSAPLPNFHW